ncbi:MAG: hypothetical protein AAF548_19945 [Actinomycetota bacterium]
MSDATHDVTDDELEAMIQGMARRSVEATERRLAEESPPPGLVPASRRVPRRAYVYAAAAAAAVALIVGFAALAQPDDAPLDAVASPSAESAPTTAPPSSVASAAGSVEAQVAADSVFATSLGLTIGTPLDDPAPDLIPVTEGENVLGYLFFADQSAFSDSRAFVTYGPDATTIRGVWDVFDARFTPIEDDPELPPTLGGGGS